MKRWQVALAAMVIAVVGSGCTTIVRNSVSSTGTEGNAQSRQRTPRSISDDGRYVVFSSSASNLVANDTNGVDDVFRRDNVNGTTVRVSVTDSGGQLTLPTTDLAISGAGDDVAFATSESLEAADTNGAEDVYVRTVSTGKTQLVSVFPGGSQLVPPGVTGAIGSASISDDGHRVLIVGSFPGSGSVIVRDRVAGTTTGLAGGFPTTAVLSGDGSSFVETVLCANGPCPYTSYFAKVAATVEPVSIDTACGFRSLDVSADGRYVVGSRFGAYPTFTCAEPTGLVRWDATTKTFTKVPLQVGLDPYVSISNDGRFVASNDQLLVTRVADLTTGVVQIADSGPGPAFAAGISGNGRYVAFSTNSQLAADDSGQFDDVYTRYAIQPGISSISPTTFPIGAAHATLTINGAELLAGLTVSVGGGGGGVTVNSVTVDSPTKATVDVTVSPTAVVGARNVVVSNTGGFGHSDALCAGCLTVN